MNLLTGPHRDTEQLPPTFSLLEHPPHLLGQSFTWLGNPLLIIATTRFIMYTHPPNVHSALYHCAYPRRECCARAQHTCCPLCGDMQEPSDFLRNDTISYGGGVRVHVSRPLHHLYAVPTQTCLVWRFRSCLEMSAPLKRYGNCRWQERTSFCDALDLPFTRGHSTDSG
jgi:hypothetical protein